MTDAMDITTEQDDMNLLKMTLMVRMGMEKTKK